MKMEAHRRPAKLLLIKFNIYVEEIFLKWSEPQILTEKTLTQVFLTTV